MHLSMLSRSFCYQYLVQYSFNLLAAFPQSHRLNNEPRSELNVPIAMTIISSGKQIWRTGNRTSGLLFSSPVRYRRSSACIKMHNYSELKEGDFKKNMVGKGENAGNQHFLLFPQCFIPIRTLILSI